MGWDGSAEAMGLEPGQMIKHEPGLEDGQPETETRVQREIRSRSGEELKLLED